ncbi:ROK family protein [Acinetobacter pittii]|uniref:ROK family protein n=1 Tax=Acinetobacter pittii TaxID=48296 RepID=UPI000D34173B|nr:ROK family protein [Acinetobacter pittii]PTV47362.1 hypothetical protein DBL01_16555 [Acinetobacter pittii]
MKYENILVYDIGGTTIRAALYDCKSNSLKSIYKINTPNKYNLDYSSQDDILRELEKSIKYLGFKILEENGCQPSYIVVGMPGPVNENGEVLQLPTIVCDPLNEVYNAKLAIQSIFNSDKCYVVNDITAAGFYFKNEKDFCILSIGSGVGGKVFISGKPLLGNNSIGGEFGHIKVNYNKQILCDCGETGHIGSVCSGRGILKFVKESAKNDYLKFKNSILYNKKNIELIKNEEIVYALNKNDNWTVETIKKALEPLVTLVCTLHLTIGIDKFVIIGGFAIAANKPLKRFFEESIKENTWDLGQNFEEMITYGENIDYGLLGCGIIGKERIKYENI